MNYYLKICHFNYITINKFFKKRKFNHLKIPINIFTININKSISKEPAISKYLAFIVLIISVVQTSWVAGAILASCKLNEKVRSQVFCIKLERREGFTSETPLKKVEWETLAQYKIAIIVWIKSIDFQFQRHRIFKYQSEFMNSKSKCNVRTYTVSGAKIYRLVDLINPAVLLSVIIKWVIQPVFLNISGIVSRHVYCAIHNDF